MLVLLEAQGVVWRCMEIYWSQRSAGFSLRKPCVWEIQNGMARHGLVWHENAPKRRQFRETTVEFDACELNCSLAFASFGPRQHELRDPELDRRAQGAISFPELDRAQEEMRPSRSKRKIDRKSELDGASCQK